MHGIDMVGLLACIVQACAVELATNHIANSRLAVKNVPHAVSMAKLMSIPTVASGGGVGGTRGAVGASDGGFGGAGGGMVVHASLAEEGGAGGGAAGRGDVTQQMLKLEKTVQTLRQEVEQMKKERVTTTGSHGGVVAVLKAIAAGVRELRRQWWAWLFFPIYFVASAILAPIYGHFSLLAFAFVVPEVLDAALAALETPPPHPKGSSTPSPSAVMFVQAPSETMSAAAAVLVCISLCSIVTSAIRFRRVAMSPVWKPLLAA
eukprot:gnl/TRDRNA2_/TRDRNA2_34924_c0_seq1.p1 gnl/TRDRNA2_/TRDRNA2_34924_c0~~gnl/TRDRNA2_/TRDRNA2_34924_c0_seq1.p1  ORF type:complete len:262 (+),score=33.00 gnl/TRDRNA2_/TRDRNA2_34924_c0_seq1:2-787(+)